MRYFFIFDAATKLHMVEPRKKVVCVIPAFNEEKTVRRVIEGAIAHVDEVVVVDDGSIDKTYEEAVDTKAIVIRHEENYGVGRATRTGIEKALNLNADLIVTLDADGEHDPDVIPKLVQTAVDKAKDIVVGSRFIGEHAQAYGMPILNRASNKISTLCVNLLFGTRITDSQSGLRVYTTHVFKKVEGKEDKYIYLTEILIKAISCGLSVSEVPIESVYRRDKKLRHSLKETLQYPLTLLRIKMRT